MAVIFSSRSCFASPLPVPTGYSIAVGVLLGCRSGEGEQGRSGQVWRFGEVLRCRKWHGGALWLRRGFVVPSLHGRECGR
ncbi:MAG: hypothetical protein IJK84_05840 [Bacteroidales bacterium]|nr:hypothetical protein [Bacteroidales bacterium]